MNIKSIKNKKKETKPVKILDKSKGVKELFEALEEVADVVL